MPRHLTQMETLFKGLADDTRLRILGLLLAGEVCVCDIHRSLKIPQSKTSRHLAYLRRSGLVETRREGLWIHYRLGRPADPVLAAIVDAVRHALSHVDTVRKDGERLQKRTGCCVPTPRDVRSAACCATADGHRSRAMSDVRIEPATPHDIDDVFALLARNGLPPDGLREHLATTFVAREAGRIVGSAALEIYADGALLRSVAVEGHVQGRGVGRRLTDAALRLAQEHHAPAVYLLTTTAEHYFPKLGFERVNRSAVPQGVQASVEFKGACPTSAIVMRKALIAEVA